MKLPLFRLIHDIINENADKSFANHVGCVMAHRNRPLFSVMNVTAITMHTASGFGKTEGTHTHSNASILSIWYIIHSRITEANLFTVFGEAFAAHLLITATLVTLKYTYFK